MPRDGTMLRLHAALAIVNDSHVINLLGATPWKHIEDLVLHREDCPFWLVAMSGKMLSAKPSDISTDEYYF